MVDAEKDYKRALERVTKLRRQYIAAVLSLPPKAEGQSAGIERFAILPGDLQNEHRQRTSPGLAQTGQKLSLQKRAKELRRAGVSVDAAVAELMRFFGASEQQAREVLDPKSKYYEPLRK